MKKIVKPLIDELKPKQPGESAKPPLQPPAPAPAQPAESDQDAGGGYNPDHTIPQP